MNYMKNFINNKTGAGAIEQSIILLIFISLFCFVYDVILVSYHQYAISEASNKVVRIISVQGGVMRSTPIGYQDETGNTYKTKNKIIKSLKTYMLGMEANLKSIYLTNTKTKKTVDLMNDGSDFKINYKDKFKLRIEYTYNWSLTKNIIPAIAKDIDGHVERFATGEFNYDNK